MANYCNLSDKEKLEIVKDNVKTYPDFPKPGVIFKDLFSVLENPPAFALLNELLVKKTKEIQPPVQCIVALEARGFLFGPIIALELQIPFIPIRKKGKLAGKVRSYMYSLEYGKDTVEIQENIIKQGQNVLIVDDLLATGGTLQASIELVKQVGGNVANCLVVIELLELNGRKKLPVKVVSLIQY